MNRTLLRLLRPPPPPLAGRRRAWIGGVSVAVLLLAAPPIAGSLVKELGFLALHRNAGAIFHGRCLGKKEVSDGEAIPFTEYTFEVLEAVKGCRDPAGKPLKVFTFRHAGVSQGRVRPDGLEEAPIRFGLPVHEVGEEAVLFLTRESPAGLCAPVGLGQGKFAVERDRKGVRLKNPRGFQLFRAAAASAFKELEKDESVLLKANETTVDLALFLGLCRKVKA